MKKLIVFFAFAITCASLCLLTSCGSDTATKETTKATPASGKTGPEYTSAYICPMHCKGSGSNKPGVCPVCKMDYVVNKNAVKAKDAEKGHSHEGHDHEGHDHDGHDHEGHNHEGHDH